MKLGAEYATTDIDTVLASDTLPRESVAVAVKVIVPDEFKSPVVSIDSVPEYPPPLML